ncbi:2-alkenal reductase [Dictyobacter aurantiacus]|uniref:2-alkenal reductase n=2 Tax=Dictyobacter aurantiacus TaxID=1936993 RepID=A0A401ZPS3_9CHLR|nr:2-alkenal reductase [Dictyobacter aurantiacus]
MQFIALPLIALLMGALGGWLAAGAATHSANALFPGANQSTEQVAAKFRTSVVQINVETQTGGGLGSGVIIDPRGYIVTNNHVVNNGLNYQVVLYDNTRLPANVVGTDPNDDLAVVKINPPKHLSVANIGDSSRLQVGQPVLAIGNPLGITQTVTGGIVSALGRNINEGQNNLIINAIQTDAAINPGNSGGALVNMQGNLIGIPTLVPIDPEFKTPASGVGFAIPSNRVKFIVPQLINSGRVVQSGRADIGVNVVSVDPDIADQAQLPVDHGALIVNVKPDSAAATAGLKRGDIIVEANNQSIQDTAMLQDFLINKSPGQTITLQIYRGNQQMPVKVQLGEQQFG